MQPSFASECVVLFGGAEKEKKKEKKTTSVRAPPSPNPVDTAKTTRKNSPNTPHTGCVNTGTVAHNVLQTDATHNQLRTMRPI